MAKIMAKYVRNRKEIMSDMKNADLEKERFELLLEVLLDIRAVFTSRSRWF